MYDAIVVGARCAGAPLAMLLARRGHRVLVVDRATFPSDTMSTHFIQSPGMMRLAGWGLIDRVMATGCPPLTKIELYADGEGMEFENPPRPAVPGLAAPRRTVLDKILVDAAREAGAEVIEGVTVTSPIVDGGRVCGIEGYTNEGPLRAEARFVIGADGRNSVIARAVDAAYRKHVPEKAVGYYSYFSDVDLDCVYLHVTDHSFCVAFPTNDGLTTVAVGCPGRDVKEFRRDIEGNFLTTLDELGDMGERVRAGQRAEKYVGLFDIVNFLRTAHGPGWALVGDAAYFKDPAPADGISDAFRGAEYLAEALDDTLSGRVTEDDALSRYEHRHDEMALPLFGPTVKMAAVGTKAAERLNAFIELRMMTEQESESISIEEEAAK